MDPLLRIRALWYALLSQSVTEMEESLVSVSSFRRAAIEGSKSPDNRSFFRLERTGPR